MMYRHQHHQDRGVGSERGHHHHQDRGIGGHHHHFVLTSAVEDDEKSGAVKKRKGIEKYREMKMSDDYKK